jgi:hypothetical protein
MIGLSDLKISEKISRINALFVLPMIVLMGFYIYVTTINVTFLQQEKTGSQFLPSLSTFYGESVKNFMGEQSHASFSLIKNLVTNDVYHLSSKDCFATKRLVKHDEIEYALPLETGVDAIKEIADFLNTTTDFVMFPVEIRTSKKDDIPLSPGYGRDSIWIAVHTYSKDNHQEIFKNCEKIFLKYNGRPHWGKFHYLRYSSLKQLYPEFEVFNQLRKSIDSQGVFLNDYLESLFEPSKV